MKLSVACNFDEDLLEGLKPYPVYEIYGKLIQENLEIPLPAILAAGHPTPPHTPPPSHPPLR